MIKGLLIECIHCKKEFMIKNIEGKFNGIFSSDDNKEYVKGDCPTCKKINITKIETSMVDECVNLD